jgi:hypothetical protein
MILYIQIIYTDLIWRMFIDCAISIHEEVDNKTTIDIIRLLVFQKVYDYYYKSIF